MSRSTSQGGRVRKNNGDAMKIEENDMEVVGFFCQFFIALLAVFQSGWLLFPNVSLPFGLPERCCLTSVWMGALWGGCGDAGGPGRVWGMTRGFRMLRSLPRGGATPSAAFPEEADTLEQRGARKQVRITQTLKHKF